VSGRARSPCVGPGFLTLPVSQQEAGRPDRYRSRACGVEADAFEIRLRAEHRIGEMMTAGEDDRAKVGRPKKTGFLKTHYCCVWARPGIDDGLWCHVENPTQ
jgi:hypothetical protein